MPKCRSDQIINPATGRCVLKRGKIGQQLLKRGGIRDKEKKRPAQKIDWYKGVTSFEELVHLNVRFLRGEKIDTPYHGDSVDEETIPLLGKLIRINQAGFLSMSGQPALRETVWHARRQGYCQFMQKSFIYGFVRRDVAKRLSRFLKKQPVYFEMYNLEPFSMTMDTFPKDWYNLTKDRCAARKADLKKLPWSVQTSRRPMTESDTFSIFRKYPRIVSLLKRECVQIQVACPEYGKGSVEDVLLSFFDARRRPPTPIPRPPRSQPPTPIPRSPPRYVKECDINSFILAFFQSMFDLASPTLTPCETIGRKLLYQCVSPEESKHYSFANILGFGLNGFVFECMYKGVEPRAVKMVIISDKMTSNIVPVTPLHHLESVSEEQIRREFKIHCQLAGLVTPSSGFKVLKIFGDLAIMKPPLYEYRIGIYIMQSMLIPTLREDVFSMTDKQLPALIVQKVETIPKVLSSLHALGYAHSDLHWGNIAFDPADPERPIVFDFGRTLHLASTFSDPEEAAMYRMLDYTIPLDALAGQHDLAIELYNAYVHSAHRLIWDDVNNPALLRSALTFEPVTLENVLERKEYLMALKKFNFFKKGSFFDIAIDRGVAANPVGA